MGWNKIRSAEKINRVVVSVEYHFSVGDKK